VHKANNCTAICEPIVKKMWEPRRLITQWASTSCYRDSFTYFIAFQLDDGFFVSAQNGFTLKRECGLGPCGFEDTNVKRGLGMDVCDRSKATYFCVFCCTQSGCNKAGAAMVWPSVRLLAATAAFVASVSLQNVNSLIVT
jgi:hypothetical protein